MKMRTSIIFAVLATTVVSATAAPAPAVKDTSAGGGDACSIASVRCNGPALEKCLPDMSTSPYNWATWQFQRQCDCRMDGNTARCFN